MASITAYAKWWVHALTDGVVDLNDGSYKVSLHTSTYSVSTAHETWDDTTNEVSGTNYTTGGSAIGSVSVTESGGTTTCDGSDVTWSQSGGGFSDARYAVIYYDTGTTTTSPLQGYIDFGGNKGNVTGDLTIQWNGSGIFTIA